MPGVARRDRLPYFWTKRLIDIFASVLLLVLLSPLLLVLAIVVKLDSPGPALFAQQRAGFDWRRRRLRSFTLYKFRTMKHECDQTVHEEYVRGIIRAQKHPGGSEDRAKLLKLKRDRRVTRIGAFLRRASLDELPQFWNVLIGDMSMVGPRPVPMYELSEYDAWHGQRLLATPGITGLWQVRARGRASFNEMVRLDIEYINRQSLWLDALILLLTIPAVLSGNGAE